MITRLTLPIYTLLIALFLLTGCATLPSPESMKKDTADFELPKIPDSNKAMIYVVRPSVFGTLVRFNVFLDNEDDSSEIGYNRGSQYIYFQVTPGKHKIMSKAENWAEMSVDVKAGDIVFIKQNAEIGIIMARNSLSLLEEHEGKYHIKRSNVGTIKEESHTRLK